MAKLSIGIIGLPNAGKSTLFRALTSIAVPAESYPFCTIEPNLGIVPVPDKRFGRPAVERVAICTFDDPPAENQQPGEQQLPAKNRLLLSPDFSRSTVRSRERLFLFFGQIEKKLQLGGDKIGRFVAATNAHR